MRYSEEIQFFSKTFYIILGGIFLAVLILQQRGIERLAPVLIVGVMFPLLFGRLLITVEENVLRISFGYIGLIKKDIPLSYINEARVVEYRPVREFGGWGIRCGKFEGQKTGCYNLRGNRGILLSLSREIKVCIMNTSRLIIGCESPEKLKTALGK